MDYCTRCGRRTEPDNLFCTGCGGRLDPPVTVTAERPPRQPPAQPSRVTHPRTSQAAAPHTRAAEDRAPWPRRDVRLTRGVPPWATVTVAALAVVACGAVVAIIVTRSSPVKHINLSSNTAAASVSSTSAQSPTSGAPAEQVAAQDLSQLLAQSATDRSAIVAAVNDVNSCGSDLAADIQTFQQAAVSRQSLLSQLTGLPDSYALPTQMLQDLTSAWQSSYQADQDFAGWANDENSNGCTANDTSDSDYQAATEPDDQATADKQAFVNLWNPIASQYGLPTYQQNQL